jgi:glycerol-3-phosphate dehydrogenase (NAD(P)+)
MTNLSVDETRPRTIAVMGGGSWATALAKLLLRNCESIVWYMRRDDRIADFKESGHNPTYLSDVEFDVNRIHFTSDINEAVRLADAVLFAMPSPYFKSHMAKITEPLHGHTVISAIKGVVPEDNVTVADYMVSRYGVPADHVLVIGGPCHAEEIALDRTSYLTIGCSDIDRAEWLAGCLRSHNLHASTSTDVEGIEYAAVLKNVYALVAGVIHGMKIGDNFTAVLVSNAVREMERFINAAAPRQRNICDSVYLGDLLVTSYSKFSRNHNFGSMIGRGYSIKAAIMEMEQTAEGYFGTKCIHEINEKLAVDMPILDCIYSILYQGVMPRRAISRMATRFN